MSAFLLALFLVPSANGIDLSRLETKDSAWAYAQEIQAKSTESEQTILKTLLGERAHWHPDAPSLLEEVDKRDGDNWRRLSAASGRRLPGYQVGAHFYCDGGTEAECKNQLDDQCKPCHWDFWCDKFKCSDYKNETECCGNAHARPTGCRWQKGENTNSMMCVENTCDNIIKQKDMSDADAETACNAASGCFYGCEGGLLGKTRKCLAGAATDYNCNCGDASGTCEKKKAASGSLDDLSNALSGPSCNIMDCAKCLNGKSCSDKKTAATKSDMTGCGDKCKELTQCDAETECLFCGLKKGAACTPSVASAPTTCAAGPPVVAEVKPACDKACKDAEARCPSSCSRRLADTRRLGFKCYDKNAGSDAGGAQQGAVITTGAAIVAIMTTMLH